MRALILASLLLLAAPIPVPAADYYVDPVRGDDASPGTALQPWKTLSHAALTANSGSDVIHAGAGTYGPADVGLTPGTRLVGAGAGRSLVLGTGIGGVGIGATGVTLEDLTFRDMSVFLSCWWRGTPSLSTVVRRCRFERAPMWAWMSLPVGPSDYSLLIEDNVFVDSQGPHFSEVMSDIPVDISLHLTLRNNLVVRGQLLWHGASTSNFSSWQTYATIVNNTVVDSTGDAVVLQSNYWTTLESVVLSNNLFVGGSGYAVSDWTWSNLSNLTEAANNQFSGFALGDYLHNMTGPKPTAVEVNTIPGASGNFDAAPIFVDAAAGDYRLAPGSPGIDAARDASAPPDDLAGYLRPIDGDGDTVAVADVGCFETNPGVALLRNTDFTKLDPLTPDRAAVLPVRSSRDDFRSLLPLGGFEDAGVLRDVSRPLALYQLVRTGNDLYLVKTTEVRLEYGFGFR